MTTNQQIDRLITVLYDYQVKQKSDWTDLPTYSELCVRLFADTPGLNEQHYRNLLYILVSKKLVQIQADGLQNAFNKPITLKPETIIWYEHFRSYLDYLDYLEQKNQPRAFLEDFDESEPEESARKSIWVKIPLWGKVILLIAILAAVIVIAIVYGKETI